MADQSVLDRLDELERQVRTVYWEILELRKRELAPEPAAAAPTVAATAVSTPSRPAAAPAPVATASEPEREQPPVREPRPRRELDLTALVGPRAFALAGGVVTLLGVVFLFVLAVDRGWIGPTERVGLGALTSALVLLAGVFAHRRYGNLHAAVAAAGAGLAGGYATLLAAAARYDLVPAVPALVLAAAIATVGTVLALAWRSEIVAGIGLLGAMAVPLAVAFDGGLSVLGTAFVALVFVATAIVAIRMEWRGLLVAGGIVSLVQIGGLVLERGEGAPGSVVALAAVFWALYLATGVGRQLALGAGIDRLVPPFVLGSGAFAASAAAILLNGQILGLHRQGVAMLAAAALTSLAGAALYRRFRDLGALLVVAGLAVGALAFADLLGGASLATGWAIQAVALAWLAGRVRDSRFAAVSVGYIGLALGHVLLLDAPPDDLFGRGVAAGVPAVLALAAGALLTGLLARRWSDPVVDAEAGVVTRVLAVFGALRRVWSAGALWTAGAAAVYAASLGLVAEAGFDRGHVAVSGLWAAVGVALLAVAGRLGSTGLRLGGYAFLGAAVVKALLFDPTLQHPEAGLALLLVAAAVLAAALLERDSLPRLAPALAVGSAMLAAGGVPALVTDGGSRGLILLALSAVYGALGAAHLTRARDLTTGLWASGLALGLGASVLLLAGTALVAVWAVACALLALAAVRAHEPRLQLAALVLAVLTVAETLIVLAPPVDLFSVNAHPADGVLALIATLGALVAVAALARVVRSERDTLDESLLVAVPTWRPWAFAGSAVLALHAASLAVLGLSVELGGAELAAEFQRGHTVVSALWGVVGLAALVLGLRRRLRPLRQAGIALFGLSLAKLFVYDLSSLSSVARAFSFLAVGLVLLLAGFFCQRIAAELGDRNGQPA